MDELIRRQDAVDSLGEEPKVWDDMWKSDQDYYTGMRNQYRSDKMAIESVPSVEGKNIMVHKNIMTVSDIKNCPCCNKKAHLFRMKDDADLNQYENKTSVYQAYRIICDNCGITSRRFCISIDFCDDGVIDVDFSKMVDVVEKWNARGKSE